MIEGQHMILFMKTIRKKFSPGIPIKTVVLNNIIIGNGTDFAGSNIKTREYIFKLNGDIDS